MTANLLTVLPMALVMIAGPQIVTAIFLATSAGARRNSVAFLAGVALAVTFGVSLFYFSGGLANSSDTPEGSSDTLDIVIIVLLLVLAGVVFLRRKDTTQPAWMGRLQEATPAFAFRLGVLLFLAMPTDILTMLTVGHYLGNHASPWWHVLGFVALTVLLAGVPLLVLLLLGDRANEILPRVRDWMNAHSWIVSEAVIALFVAIEISSLAG